MPPLSFPKDRPPHRGRAPERYRRVSSRPLRWRIPAAGPRPRRDGSLLGLASDCLGRVVPSGQPSTDSNRARRAGADESSGTSAGPPRTAGLRFGGGPLPAPTRWERVNHEQLAAGQRPRDHETGGRALRSTTEERGGQAHTASVRRHTSGGGVQPVALTARSATIGLARTRTTITQRWGS